MKGLICLFLLLCSCTSSRYYTEIPDSGVEQDFAYLSNESYSYLGKGAQILCYESKDQTHVLKLFKKTHERPFFKSPFFQNTSQKKQRATKWSQKFVMTCKRYEWAFEHLKEETGLIALHFTKTPSPIIVTIDGRKIDLSKHPFIIQKKALLPAEYLAKHPENIEQALKSFNELFKSRLEKGFSDSRQSLGKNYGFIDDRAVQLDPGKLEPFEGDFNSELARLQNKVSVWFQLSI